MNKKILSGLLIVIALSSCNRCVECTTTTRTYIGTVDDPLKQESAAQSMKVETHCRSERKNKDSKEHIVSTDLNTITGWQKSITEETICKEKD